MRIRGSALAALLLACAAPAFAAKADPVLVPDFSRTTPTRADATPAAPAEPSITPAAKAAPPAAPAKPAKEEAAPAAPAARRRDVKKEEFAPEEESGRRPWIMVRERVWYAKGAVNARDNVQVPPNLVNPPGTEVFEGVTDDYNATGAMFVESAELAPLSWLSFQAEYGRDRRNGVSHRHFWVHAPDATTLTYNPTGATWNNPNHEDDLIESADLSAKREWVSGTVYFRVLDADVRSPDYLQLRDSIDVGLGLERYKQTSHMTNLALTANTNKRFLPGTPAGPIPGDDSTYTAIWKGPHLALRGEVAERDGFAIESVVLFNPFMLYEGDGYDNLSVGVGGLQAASPNYVDTAHGTAIHFQLGASWTWKLLRLEAGYQRLYFFSRTGSRVFFNNNGTTSTVTLDFATAELGGAYAGAALRF